jgi:hypothetical protein
MNAECVMVITLHVQIELGFQMVMLL